MRSAHGCPAFRAVANGNDTGYHAAMTTNPFFHDRSDAATPRDERRATGIHDVLAIARKALERWENEGGRIPELPAANGRDSPARSERF